MAGNAILWTGLAVCIAMCAGRPYIRYACFQRLLVDDWLIIFALVMLACVAGLGQTYLQDIYMLMAVATGEIMPCPNFPGKPCEVFGASAVR